VDQKINTIVGLGEVLWDLLPGGKQLGGAPANFAYVTSLLGDRGIVASRVGEDSLGREAIQELSRHGLPIAYLQSDSGHPTGTVNVEVDPEGQPKFEIMKGVAWDFLEWTPQWQELAGQADAVCFGSLAQRSLQSRETILAFLEATSAEAVRIFDVNLRQSFYTAEVLAASLKLADLVKLNHEELPRVMELLRLKYDGEESSAQRLQAANGLELVCVTRGAQGSLLVSADGTHEHPGFRIKVADTVGAGDAFTAGLLHHYLRQAPLDAMNEAANRLGAWVASDVGAMPAPGAGGLLQTLERIA